MKNGQAARRSRGRSNSRSNNSGQRFSDNNRNEPRVKGNANQLIEKYKSLAKDAMASGDRVLAENYLQHSDHYLRVTNEKQAKSADKGVEQATGDAETSPRQNRRPRRPRKDEAEASTVVQAETPASEENVAEASKETESAPKKPRRGRKPKIAAEDGVLVNGEAEAPAEEAPKPRRRRKLTVDPAAEESAAE